MYSEIRNIGETGDIYSLPGSILQYNSKYLHFVITSRITLCKLLYFAANQEIECCKIAP